MKRIQKLILPALIVLAIVLMYEFYFVKGGELGSYNDFDPNNNAVKDIRVQLLINRGIERTGGEVSFFTSDRNGRVVKAYGDATLPAGFENSEVIILRGHLTQSGFHVHEILLD